MEDVLNDRRVDVDVLFITSSLLQDRLRPKPSFLSHYAVPCDSRRSSHVVMSSGQKDVPKRCWMLAWRFTIDVVCKDST